jgi:hypothetical protein
MSNVENMSTKELKDEIILNLEDQVRILKEMNESSNKIIALCESQLSSCYEHIEFQKFVNNTLTNVIHELNPDYLKE